VSAAPRGARVRLPPPLIFGGGWLAAWALHRRLPFDIDGTGGSAPQTMLGAGLILAGLVLMGWAIRTLLFARTTILPHGVVRQVVTSGPFRFSRNPIYLGMSGIYAGAALVLNMAWPLVMLPVVIAIVTTAVILREERYLTDAFGDAYGSYWRRVRRWL
jgi:protein-S-isoprenylcysteine O-methyltransferase Ste14